MRNDDAKMMQALTQSRMTNFMKQHTFNQLQMVADLLEDGQGRQDEAHRALYPSHTPIRLMPFAAL